MPRFSGTLVKQEGAVEDDLTSTSKGFSGTPVQEQIPPGQNDWRVDTQAQLERMFGETAPAPQRQVATQDYFGSGVIEPTRALASGQQDK